MNIAPVRNSSLEGLNVTIPTLPHTFLLAMGLSREVDKIAIDEVVDVIQNDPGAVTRVLRVVNSAFYAMRTEVTNVRRAVVALGPEAVLGIVMSMSLIDMKNNLQVVTNDVFQKLVRHSIASGYLARQLVLMSRLAHEETPENQDYPNEAFTMGLLHDFGKIVLMFNYPDEAADFYINQTDADMDDAILQARECEVFGFDHVQAGEYLMNELNFLHSMTDIVARHHDWNDVEHLRPSTKHLLYFVVASNKLVNSMGLCFNHLISRQSLYEDPFWDVFFAEDLFEEKDRTVLFEKIYGLHDQVEAYVHEVT